MQTNECMIKSIKRASYAASADSVAQSGESLRCAYEETMSAGTEAIFFSCLAQLSMQFIRHIIVKIPTIANYHAHKC